MTMAKLKKSLRDRRRRLYKLGDDFGIDIVLGVPRQVKITTKAGASGYFERAVSTPALRPAA